MNALRRNPIFAAATVCAACLTIQAGGNFQLRANKQNVPEAGPVTVCVLVTDKESYSFLPPSGWRVETDEAEQKVNMTAPDGTLMSLHFPKFTGAAGEVGTQEQLRRQVLARYPGAVLVEESACYAEGGSGSAFDLEWTTEKGAKFATRLAIISVKGALVEISMAATPEKFRIHSLTFSSLLNTFQLAAPGHQ